MQALGTRKNQKLIAASYCANTHVGPDLTLSNETGLRNGVATISRQNCRSLLQNIVSFIGLFCKRDL